MFYRCLPHAVHAPATDRGAKRTVRRGNKSLTVDIHCHFVSQRATDLAKPHFTPDKESAMRYATPLTREILLKQNERIWPTITGSELRLKDMDRMGIDVQAVSPGPTQYYYWLDPEIGRAAARMVNDDLAALCARHPDRLVAMGTVPMQEPRMAVAELERCVRDLGMRGIEISSHVNGVELSAPAFAPFWAKAEELGILVFLHPLGTPEGSRLAKHYFNNVIANPMEATIAVGHLIFDGVLDRHPGLKLCVAHGGGYVSHYFGRMDHTFRAREDGHVVIKRHPSEYLARLYFDTVLFDPRQLEHLVACWGADRIVLGTDYPYDMAEADPVGFVGRAKGLSASDRAKIRGLNAAKLLGLKVAAKPARGRP
jgi:aminocarboxymuconate-semialdehyde decarboxylase